MTAEEAIIALNNAAWIGSEFAIEMTEKAVKVAIEALEKTSDKDCSKCRNRLRCAIHDNFNIDYCSDWEKVEE